MPKITRPLLLGARGNMGSRYAAIFRYCGVDFVPVDVGDSYYDQHYDGVLIATPTACHVEHIRKFADSGLPILCEKPITKNLVELDEVIKDCEKHGTMLQMVSQYDELVTHSSGPTVYDYFKHGGDGLYWDTMNIIYHARGSVEIREQSPIWRCVINGQRLSIADMDMAYIKMIAKWLCGPRSDLERIWQTHVKAWEASIKCQPA